MTGSFFISTPPEAFFERCADYGPAARRVQFGRNAAIPRDILSLKYIACEAPICGHFAGHDAASVCGGRALWGVYAESRLTDPHAVRLFRGVGFRD